MSLSDPFLTNQSRVTFSSGGISQVTYSNTVSTPLIGPVITLAKRASDSQASLDQIITYGITMENTGNREAQVTLYDALPPGTAFIANSLLRDGAPLPGANPASGIDLGTFGVGTTVNIMFQVILVSLPADMLLVNRARADFVFFTDGGRMVMDSAYSDVVTIQVKGYFLSAYLQASTEQTFVGDIVTYTISIVNEGNVAVQNTVVTFYMLAGAQFVPGSVTVGDVYTPSANPNLGIPAGPIAAGASLRVSFRVLITEVPDSRQFTNEAYVRYQAGEWQENAVTNAVTIAIIQPAVALRKSVNLTRAVPGDRLIYELVAENNGSMAVDVILTDSVPDGTLFIWDSVLLNGVPLRGAQPASGISLGTLRAGSRTVIAFQSAVVSAVEVLPLPSLVNHAQVSFTFRLSDGRLVQESVMSNPAATTLYSPLLHLQLEVKPVYVEAGDLVQFELQLTNQGNWAASSVVLSGLVPMEASLLPESIWVDGQFGGESYTGRSLPIGALAPGATVRITYLALIKEGLEVSVIRGFAEAIGRFGLDGRDYSREVRSNVYSLILEEQNE